MGPVVLFDKSFLQSLSIDEAVWFDAYFSSVISPYFYIETLADLGKQGSGSGRSPEHEVQVIADKFPEMSGTPCVHHRQLVVGDLLGHRVPMNAQIPVANARQVRTKQGRIAAVVEQLPEAVAFARWQEQRFTDIEREFSAEWRRRLIPVNVHETARVLGELGLDQVKCKTLTEAKLIAGQVPSSSKGARAQAHLLFELLQLPDELRREIYARWEAVKLRPLAQYAPFAGHVLAIELFFHLALRSSLISAERPSNRIDIAYLYYLPFCHFFVSGDKLHRACAAEFLRNDQSFVWGPDLKSELKRINAHFKQLPESEQRAGVYNLASRPVGEDDSLLVRLWDKFAARWRDRAPLVVNPHGEASRKLAASLNEIVDSPSIESEEAVSADDLDSISIQRTLRRIRGSWVQIPDDIAGSGHSA